jgi:oxygen-independent coproporphyrinogen-3 oxidase
MEETNTVLGLGAGAMTKFVFNKENRIERVRNKKNIELYMTDIINLAKH